MNWKVFVLKSLFSLWEKALTSCESLIETQEEREVFDQKMLELKDCKRRLDVMAQKQGKGK